MEASAKIGGDQHAQMPMGIPRKKCSFQQEAAVKKYNARLVTKSYPQLYDVDYNETFSV